MSASCRSDCQQQVTRKLTMVSQSGRTWAAVFCDDDEHMAGFVDAVRAMGFELQQLSALEPAGSLR